MQQASRRGTSIMTVALWGLWIGQALSAAPSHCQTCGDVKALYKANQCCNEPKSKPLAIPPKPQSFGRTEFWNTKFHQYDVLNRQMNACPMAGILTADVVGELLRFVGHDFMSDNKIDGCFGVDNVENKGLGLAMTYIYNYTDTFCPAYLSKADCSVLLSESAMDITVPGARPNSWPHPTLETTGMPLANQAEIMCSTTCEIEHDRRSEIGSCEQALNDKGACPYNQGGPYTGTSNAVQPGVLFFDFAAGRPDKSGELHLPHPDCDSNSGPPINISFSTDFDQLVRVMTADGACGDIETTVALFGIHTVGQARDKNSGMSGFWSDPSKMSYTNFMTGETQPCTDGDIGCGPSVFDIEWYTGFFEMGWKKEPNGQWVCIPDSAGVRVPSLTEDNAPDVFGSHAVEVDNATLVTSRCFDNSLRMTADMIIVFDIDDNVQSCEWVPKPGSPNMYQNTCRFRSSTFGEVVEYAQSNFLWVRAFVKAWKQMVDCGMDDLHKPNTLAGYDYSGAYPFKNQEACIQTDPTIKMATEVGQGAHHL